MHSCPPLTVSNIAFDDLIRIVFTWSSIRESVALGRLTDRRPDDEEDKDKACAVSFGQVMSALRELDSKAQGLEIPLSPTASASIANVSMHDTFASQGRQVFKDRYEKFRVAVRSVSCDIDTDLQDLRTMMDGGEVEDLLKLTNWSEAAQFSRQCVTALTHFARLLLAPVDVDAKQKLEEKVLHELSLAYRAYIASVAPGLDPVMSSLQWLLGESDEKRCALLFEKLERIGAQVKKHKEEICKIAITKFDGQISKLKKACGYGQNLSDKELLEIKAETAHAAMTAVAKQNAWVASLHAKFDDKEHSMAKQSAELVGFCKAQINRMAAASLLERPHIKHPVKGKALRDQLKGIWRTVSEKGYLKHMSDEMKAQVPKILELIPEPVKEASQEEGVAGDGAVELEEASAPNKKRRTSKGAAGLLPSDD